MKVIIPCCDNVSYDGILPRFLAIDETGMPMVCRAIEALDLPTNDIVISIYADHDQKFQIVELLTSRYPGIMICIISNECKNQAETIIATIEQLNYSGSFFVKDCDSSFSWMDMNEQDNYVCVSSLNANKTNVNDKSYVAADHNGFILNIKEKIIISHLFSAGGYFFTSSDKFIQYYNYLTNHMPNWQDRIYISDIISIMILNDLNFSVKQVDDYKDYGTLEEWQQFALV